MLVARYRSKTHEVELLSAGHNPPFVTYGSSGNDFPLLQAGKIRLPSNLMGISGECKTTIKTIPFPAHARLLLYTDGLVEARNPQGQQVKEKRISIAFDAQEELSARQSVHRILATWEQHRAGFPADDDTCVVVMRAV